MPRLRELAKRIASLALASNVRLRIRRSGILHAGCRIVLNLHGLMVPSDAVGSRRDLLPAFRFEELLVYLKQNFSLCTFRTAQFDRSLGPPLIISFDDGYKDFQDLAVPILRRHGVRCNQNIIPACVESGLPPLNVLIQDFVAQAPETLLKEFFVPGYSSDLRDPRAGMLLSRHVKNRPAAEQAAIAELVLPQMFRWDRFRPTRMMDLADVQQIASEHEIGAHSYSHATMSYESQEYFEDDVRRCSEYFRSKLNLPLDIYAFPNGSHTTQQVEFLERFGIAHILLVGEQFDTNGVRHGRFSFHAESASEVAWRAWGGLSRIPKADVSRENKMRSN